MDDRRFWELRFSVEVSARYHDWRRATLGRWVRIVRAVTLLGALLGLFAVSEWFVSMPEGGKELLVIGMTAIAVFTIIDLVFGFDAAARRHTDLYRRFVDLQINIAKHQESWQEYLAAWEAEAQAIRKDEPPTLWAIYAKSWNQGIESHRLDRQGYFRRISPLQRALGGILQFDPQDFPPEAPQPSSAA